MNEKMDKTKKNQKVEDGLVFQYRELSVTPEMDGPDVVAAAYALKPPQQYD